MKPEVAAYLLDCQILDIGVIEAIDEDIILEAIQNLKLNDMKIDFPNLYYTCVEIGLSRSGIPKEKAVIDNNYLDANIHLTDVTKIKAGKLEKHGFQVYRR